MDIDGPLLPARQWFSTENSLVLRDAKNQTDVIKADFGLKKRIRFDPVAVHMFNAWQHLADAKFVLATNWVQHTTPLELLEIFLANGMNVTYHPEAVTPKKFTSWRCHEVLFWLEDNRESINNFIVVDDDNTLDPNQLKYLGDDFADLADHVVFVDYLQGLSIDNFRQGCQLLGVEDSQAEKYLFNR